MKACSSLVAVECSEVSSARLLLKNHYCILFMERTECRADEIHLESLFLFYCTLNISTGLFASDTT